jgi:hypothetical protein
MYTHPGRATLYVDCVWLPVYRPFYCGGILNAGHWEQVHDRGCPSPPQAMRSWLRARSLGRRSGSRARVTLGAARLLQFQLYMQAHISNTVSAVGSPIWLRRRPLQGWTALLPAHPVGCLRQRHSFRAAACARECSGSSGLQQQSCRLPVRLARRGQQRACWARYNCNLKLSLVCACILCTHTAGPALCDSPSGSQSKQACVAKNTKEAMAVLEARRRARAAAVPACRGALAALAAPAALRHNPAAQPRTKLPTLYPCV